MKRSLLLLIAIALVLLGTYCVRAEVKLPAIFGDHMVLQQEAKLPVWGWADPGEKVSVSFGAVKAETTAGADGKWRADLPSVPAGTPPGTLIIAGKNTITISDVLVGDVWICSGQSNMEYSVNTKDQARATDDHLRLFHVSRQPAVMPCDDVMGTWQICSPEASRNFTAVGYFFGKNLQPVLNRPIGLIESAWGGTQAQAWTDLVTLQSNPTLRHYADAYKSTASLYPGGQPEFAAKFADTDAALKSWKEKVESDSDYQAAFKAWNAAVLQAKSAGQTIPPEPAIPSGRPTLLSGGPATPTFLFNGMIHPLIPFAIKGVIWYQGESNAQTLDTSIEYQTLLPAMIVDWRTRWGQGDFPFLLVQLPNIVKSQKTPGKLSTWAVLRESQSKTLSLPHTGMSVSIDIGGALHPPDKADIGVRLALVARRVAYGENLVSSGPVYDAMKIEGNKIRVTFRPDSVGSGLVISGPPWIDPKVIPVSKAELEGFAIAGEDKNWINAEATIDGNTVLVSSSQVTNPVAVRYAWADNPACNLYNKEGLPAPPFRTDTWDLNPPASASK